MEETASSCAGAEAELDELLAAVSVLGQNPLVQTHRDLVRLLHRGIEIAGGLLARRAQHDLAVLRLPRLRQSFLEDVELPAQVAEILGVVLQRSHELVPGGHVVPI